MSLYPLKKHDPIQTHVLQSIKLADLLKGAAGAALPQIPGSYDSFSNVYAALGVKGAPDIYLMDDNDQYGCCVMAAWAHAVTTFAALVGNRVIPTPDDVKTAYFKQTGGQDSGLNISTTIDYAIKNGLLGEQPKFKVFLDPTNLDHVKLGILLGACVMTGIQCTDAMQRQFQARQPWDGSGTVEGGHGILGGAWNDASDFTFLTWGNDQIATANCVTSMCDETWFVMSQELLTQTSKFSGLDLDVDQITADAQAIADRQS
jgi:hypothetical protein